MAEVFNANLETANFSQFTGSVTDGGDLSVTGAAALHGDYGMSVLIDGTGPIYAYYAGSARTDGVMRFRFYYDPNGITMANATEHCIAMVADGSSNVVGFVFIHYTSANGYGLYLGLGIDGSSTAHSQSPKVWITNDLHCIEVRITRASADNVGNGLMELWIDGSFATSVDGDNWNKFNDWTGAYFGAVSGIDGTTSGTSYFDDIVIRNDGVEIGVYDEPEPEQISVSDTGSGADGLAGLAARFTLAEAGSGADGMSGLSARATVGEAGSGNDAQAGIGARFTLADSAAGADILAGMAAALAVSEAGAGADSAPGALVTLGLLDTGSGADLLAAIAALIASSDGGSGVEGTPGISALLALLEAGAGSESINVSFGVRFTITETGSGTDGLSGIVATVMTSETGSGLDGPIIAALLGLQETGNGVDLPGLRVRITVGEAGSGADGPGTIGARVAASDTGSGADARAIAARLTVSDTASGADAISLMAYLVKTIIEAGVGTDGLSARVSLNVAESGGGLEISGVSAALTISDAGSGADALSLAQNIIKAVQEAASGTDLVGSIRVQVGVMDLASGVDLMAQIAAALQVADLGAGVEVVVAFDSATRIVAIQFKLTGRSMAFTWAARSIDISLSDGGSDD